MTAPFVHMLDLQYYGTSRYPAGNCTHRARTPRRGQGLTCSGFSVFMGVMVYEVTANTELVNPEPLLPGECRVRFLQASGPHVFIH